MLKDSGFLCGNFCLVTRRRDFGANESIGLRFFWRAVLVTADTSVMNPGHPKELDVSGTGIAELDLSRYPQLETLHCGNNELTNLDLSKNKNLKVLSCFNNQLSEIDLSANSSLEELYCNNNALTQIDISQLELLRKLWCFNNRLENLDFRSTSALMFYFATTIY